MTDTLLSAARRRAATLRDMARARYREAADRLLLDDLDGYWSRLRDCGALEAEAMRLEEAAERYKHQNRLVAMAADQIITRARRAN